MDTLSLFNQQVTQCQDDAYTLAWYLLGSEAEAEAVTQCAVEAAFHCFSSPRDDCRLLILKHVVRHCRGQLPAANGTPGAHMLHELQALPFGQRLALVLVDVLGLGYLDAACIADRPVKEVRWLLGQGRCILGQKKVQ